MGTPVALEGIQHIRKDVPEILIGAGTVTVASQVAEAADAGASFLVTAGLDGERDRRVYRHRAAAGPSPGPRFRPIGGISPDNAASYLALPNVGCVGGSWSIRKYAFGHNDFSRVRTLCRAGTQLRP